MRIDDLDYDLPPHLVAQEPLADRDASRLMVLHPDTGGTEHRVFGDLPDLLPERSLLVLNDTRVFPARLAGRKASTGGRVEVLLVRRLGDPGGEERWEALVGTSGRVREGMRIDLGTLAAEVIRPTGSGTFELEMKTDGGRVEEAVDSVGTVPLPPYIRRAAVPRDRERYQTVYARHRGSAAAPTAGLHFTRDLLETLGRRGHEIATITLHVGPGTFQPVRCDDLGEHRMHAEWVRVPATAVSSVEAARSDGRAVVAVGTTVVRALEGVARERGRLEASEGLVDAFIRPGWRFAVVDALVTNFHLPRSTLIALVMAIAGRQRTLDAYEEAARMGYRFYSYGDAMYLPPRSR